MLGLELNKMKRNISWLAVFLVQPIPVNIYYVQLTIQVVVQSHITLVIQNIVWAYKYQLHLQGDALHKPKKDMSHG